MPGEAEPACFSWDSCVLLAYLNDEEDRASDVETMLEEADEGRPGT